MNHSPTFSKFALLLTLLFIGVLFLSRSVTLQPESISRQHALQAFAPASQPGTKGGSVETGQLRTYAPVIPTTIDMSQAVAYNGTDPDGMYEKWVRGEIDLDETEGIISAAERAALIEAARKLPVDSTIQQATNGPGLQAPTPGTSFASMDYNNSGGSVPPDPEMAVGPNHIIATINVAVAIYDKSGTALLGPVAAGSLFSTSPCTGNLYDPNVIYDEESDRWFLAYDQGAQSATGGYCALISQTGNPTGMWYEYFFPLNGGGTWMDFPHAGVGDNFIFMGGNIFTNAGNFVEGRIYAFNKANLYAGAAVSTIALGLGGTIDTPQPLHLHGASTGTWPALGNTHYFLGEPYDGANYTMLEWDTTTLTNHGNINLGAGGLPVDVPQSGGSNVQANDFRPQEFEYRNGYAWTSMTISCNPGGGTVDCIRWAQIDLSSSSPPTLGPAGSGVYSSAGEYRFFPNSAVNHCDDMAIGYTKSSTSMFPSVWYTGRENFDAAGTLQAEAELKAGEITYTAFDSVPRRWGDYTSMTIDPDGLTFWYLGEYSKITGNSNGRHGTYIGSFTYPSCGTAPDFTLDTTPTTQQICTPNDAVYSVAVAGTGGFTGAVDLTAVGNPGTALFSPDPITPDASSTLTISSAAAGSYSFDVVGTGVLTPSLIHTNTIGLDVLASSPSAPTLTSPSNGATGVSTAPGFAWTAVAGAASYDIEIATDPGFTIIVDNANVATNSYSGATLSINTTYYWRVRANNSCGSSGNSAVFSFTTASGSLICNGTAVDFESGIPVDWSVVDNTGGAGIVWGLTSDPTCGIGNLTNGSNIAACADSDIAGSGSPAYDTELVSNPFDLTSFAVVTLDVAAYYLDITTGANDTFAVDVWDGATWNNELTWNEDHVPEDISLDLSSYIGLTGVQIRFTYAGNGWDWYAEVDDVSLTCSGTPVIGVTPVTMNSLQLPNTTMTQTLTISNTGTADLTWTVTETLVDCNTPTSVPWLATSLANGSTSASSNTGVDVTFDSTGYAGGVYTGILCIGSNDPVTPQVQVPVTMTVQSVDYSALAASYGVAWHVGDGSLRLGSSWTADATFGLGDDPDDDGVARASTPWVAGNSANVEVTTNAAGYVAGWFDWDNDGVFVAGEKAFGQSVPGAGTHTMTFTVGAAFNPAINSQLVARFRLYASEPTLSPEGIETPDGAAGNGEVEDFVWGFGPTAVSLQNLNAHPHNTRAIWLMIVVFLLALSAHLFKRRQQAM